MDLEKYQSISVTPVDEYKCTLSQDLVEILEKEIRETEELRNYAITAMRDWAVQNPRIQKIRLDSSWLLKHLRFKKYSLPMAQEAMERHMVLRSGSYNLQYFHLSVDVLIPSVKAIFDVNPVCILPQRDAMGRPILFFRIAQVKPESMLRDIMTAFAALLEALSEVEEYLIRGMVYVVDVSGMTASYLKIAPIDTTIKLIKNSEKCLAGRHKGLHFVNVSPALSFAFNLGLKGASKKIQERVRFYSGFDQLDIIEVVSIVPA